MRMDDKDVEANEQASHDEVAVNTLLVVVWLFAALVWALRHWSVV
jgi:hypothetical protein